MDELASEIMGMLVSDSETLEKEFEHWLVESAALPFRVAYSVLRNREDAEDVAQETLLRAYTRRVTLRDRRSLRAWIVRVSWRLALDHQRSKRRRQRRQQAVAESAIEPSAEEVAATRQMRERLWQTLDGLPEKLRIVTILAAIEGHNVREVAGLLRLPEGTVKSRLHRARKRLAEELRWSV